MLLMLCKRDGDFEAADLGLFLFVFSLVSAENEISVITRVHLSFLTSLPGTSEMGQLQPHLPQCQFLIPSLWELLWGFSYICFSEAHFYYWLQKSSLYLKTKDW